MVKNKNLYKLISKYNPVVRLKRTLDLCYGTMPKAYKVVCRFPLGISDHNVVHLLPKYKAVVKRVKPVTRQIQGWSNDSKEQLRACFD